MVRGFVTLSIIFQRGLLCPDKEQDQGQSLHSPEILVELRKLAAE